MNSSLSKTLLSAGGKVEEFTAKSFVAKALVSVFLGDQRRNVTIISRLNTLFYLRLTVAMQ